MSMTGLQMAFAYVGSCLAPPLFGLLAQNVTPGCTLVPSRWAGGHGHHV